MKKIILSSLVASASLFSSPFHCSGNECEYVSEVVIVTDQTSITEIVTNNNRMDLSNDNKMALTGQYIHAGDVKVWNLPLGYNVTDNIGLETNIPYVKNTIKSGLGDISVGANYHFGTYGSSSGLNVTTLRYKTTTGDEKKGLGMGEHSYTISHSFAKELGFVRGYALAAYTLNDEKILGDSTSLMLGVSRPCLLTEKLRTNLKVSYYNIEEVLEVGFTNSAGFKKIDVWIEFNSDKLFSGINLGAGVKIPVVDEVTSFNTTIDGSKTVLFYLSVGSFFK